MPECSQTFFTRQRKGEDGDRKTKQAAQADTVEQRQTAVYNNNKIIINKIQYILVD